MFNIEQIHAFIAAAEQGSFSAAARRLGKAQSAISTAIINLEIDTGVELFDRSSRSPVLTEAGQALLKSAQSIMRSQAEFNAHAAALSKSVETKLGVAIEQGLFVHSLLPLFDELEKRFPFLEIEWFEPGENDVADLLKAGRVDIGIMTEQEFYPQGFFFRGIGHSLLVPVCGKQHPLAALEQVSYADLRQYRQLITHGRSLQKGKQLREQRSSKVWYSESPYLVTELLEAGLGWAELPWAVAAKQVRNGNLIRLNYEFQKADILQGVDVVWTEKHAIGEGGSWLLEQLSKLPQNTWHAID